MRAVLRVMHPDRLVSLRYLVLNRIGVHTIDELDALNDPCEQLGAVESTPPFLRHANQLEYHTQRCQA